MSSRHALPNHYEVFTNYFQNKHSYFCTRVCCWYKNTHTNILTFSRGNTIWNSFGKKGSDYELLLQINSWQSNHPSFLLWQSGGGAHFINTVSFSFLTEKQSSLLWQSDGGPPRVHPNYRQLISMNTFAPIVGGHLDSHLPDMRALPSIKYWRSLHFVD